MVLISKYLVPKGFVGMTLFPFILLKNSTMKKDDVLLNHERIHLKQQLELLILPFYIWYGLEWLVKWCIYKDRYIAYKNISFEREAYFHESNLDYLKKRRIFEFLKYF